jgi:AP-2 complex subunit sigma-1
LIHLLVETLDQYFGNVCELDIVFNFHKVYGMIDELIVGGEVAETAKTNIVNSIKMLEVED